MSDKKNQINKLLKELFALSKRIEFFDAKLKDGSILRTEDSAIQKGSKVTLVSKDGVSSDVPDGDHTSEDGSTITVKSGVVDAIAPATPEKANEKMENPTAGKIEGTNPVPTNMDAPAAPAADADADYDWGMVLDTIKNLTDRIAAIEEKVSSTSMAVEKMSAEPAATPFINSPYGEFKEGTVGYELAKFRAAKKAKEEAAKANALKFAQERNSKESNVKAQAFNRAAQAPTPAPSNNKDFNIDFGMAMGTFSVGN